MLVTAYTVYVIFIKFNVQIERAFKTQLLKHKNIVRVITVVKPEQVSTRVINVVKLNILYNFSLLTILGNVVSHNGIVCRCLTNFD